MNKHRYVLSRITKITAFIYLIGALISGYLAFLVISKAMLEQNELSQEALLKSRAVSVQD